MAFQFELDETPKAGFSRMATRQVTKIIARLEAGIAAEAAAIHESRKGLKRLKTLFKTVRPAISKTAYNREYNVIREASRALSQARDLDVLPTTLAQLDSADQVAIRQIATELKRARNRQLTNDISAAAHSHTITELTAASRRYTQLEFSAHAFAIIAEGAGRGLRKLRTQHAAAIAQDEDEAYHDWRKSAQLHWRQLRLLSPAWPELMRARIEPAKRLADVLGHDHDLSALAAFIQTIPTARLKAARCQDALFLIRSRQKALRVEARALAGFLVEDEPASFARSLTAAHAARIALLELDEPFNRVTESTGTI